MTHSLTILGAYALSCTCLLAQCQPQWLPGDGVPGTSASVREAIAWDPDGVGPVPERIALLGDFTAAGDVSGTVVAYDPAAQTWQSLAAQHDGYLAVLRARPNGDLIVAGNFSAIDGVAVNHIASFNGATWTALGGGFDASATCVGHLPNGDLAAAGHFTTAGGVAVPGLARWNGATWSPLAGSVQGVVRGMTNASNGDLIAWGDFSAIDGVAADRLALFNGTNWSPLATSMSNQPNIAPPVVGSVLVRSNGDLIVFGRFTAINGVVVNDIARFDGTSWSAFGAGAPIILGEGAVEMANGDLVAPGEILAATATVERFDGTTWTSVGIGMTPGSTNVIGGVYRMVRTSTDVLFAFGFFGAADGQPASNAARWDGAAWTALFTGCDRAVSALHLTNNGDLVVGGDFHAIGDVIARGVARFDGQSWTALGGGTDRPVSCVAELQNGDIVVGGRFDTAGSVTARRLARWDGSQWHSMSTGITTLGHEVRALAVLPNGDLVVGGSFAQIGGVAGATNIARWDGASWHDLGGGASHPVRALTLLPSGELVAGGFFVLMGGNSASRVARWDGVAWNTYGSGLSHPVRALAVSPNGDLYAGYGDTQSFGLSSGGVDRWNGSAWVQVGLSFNNHVKSLVVLPDESLLVGGTFGSGWAGPATGVARWTGSNWSELTPGVQLADVRAIEVQPDGQFALGGGFTTAGAPGNSYFARVAPSCPASAAVVGAGCVGAAGPVALIADQLPWLGGTFRSTATGLPAGSLAVEVFGLGALQTPLVTLLPQGLPGCDLLVTPDVLGLRVPSGGEVSTSWSLPMTTSLVGQSFRNQVVVVEINGAISGLSSSNALLATIGSY